MQRKQPPGSTTYSHVPRKGRNPFAASAACCHLRSALRSAAKQTEGGSMPELRRSAGFGAGATIVLGLALVVAGIAEAQQPRPAPPTKLPLPTADPPAKRIVTQGLAKTTVEDLIPCGVNQPGMNLRKNPVGEIAAQDGTKFIVPTANNFQTA